MPRYYRPELDGLRFLAFLLVFISHWPKPGALELLPIANSVVAAAAQHFWRGMYGVDLFFCLSAFLLTTLLRRELSEFGRVRIRSFWIRRALRIWPLYALALVLGFFVFPRAMIFGIWPPAGTQAYELMIQRHLWPFVFFVGNWSTGIYGFPRSFLIAVLWTISLEEQFYLIVPFVMARLKSRRALFSFCGLAVLVSVVVRAYLARDAHAGTLIHVNTFTRLDSFVVGIALALIMENHKGSHPRALAAFFIGLGGLLTRGNPVELTSLQTIWDYSFIALCCGLVIWASLSSDGLKRALSSRLMVGLGKISFGLYVVHTVMLTNSERMWFWLVDKRGLNWMQSMAIYWLIIITAFGGTVAAAWISYFFYERHFLRLKESFAVVRSRPV